MSSAKDKLFKISEIFDQVQKTSSCHQRCIKELIDISEDFDEFFECIKKILSILLSQDHKKKSTFFEKSMNFFCEILSTALYESHSDNEIFDKTVNFLLKAQKLADENVRVHACKFINILLNKLIDDQINEELCDNIRNAMLRRLKDNKPAVRLEAVAALCHMQDASDPDDPIINDYIFQMTHDLNSEIRKECIDRVVLREDVIPFIIARTIDVNVKVKIAAFSKLSKCVTSLTIEDRQNIIKTGFQDISEAVKNFIFQNLIVDWLKSYEDDILELLKSVRLDANRKDIMQTTETVNYILTALFSNQTEKKLLETLPESTNKLIPFEKLNWETVPYLRFFVEKLRENDNFDNNLLNEILPEITEFLSYIKRYCSWVSNNFQSINIVEVNYILKEMFQITIGYDFSDIASCETLNNLIKGLLLEVEWISEETIVQIVKNLDNSIFDTSSRVCFVCKIVSTLLNPPTTKEEVEDEQCKQMKLAQLKVQLCRLQEEQIVCIKQEDFIKASTLKSEIEEVQKSINQLQLVNEIESDENTEKTYDVKSLIKCLDIIYALLLSPKVNKLPNELRSLKDDVVEDLLINSMKTIKNRAMKCYALCCIIDRPTAETGIHIFCARVSSYHAGNECDQETLITSINSIGDLIVLFGTELIVRPENQGPTDSMSENQLVIFAGGSSLSNVIQALVDLMDDEDPLIQEASGVALCNMIMSRRVHSSTLLSRMVLKWCKPSSADFEVEKLKQLIGCMLENFPFLPEAGKVLEKVLILTVRVLARAPNESPFVDVDINKIMKCLIELSYSSQKHEAHENLAKILCQELLQEPIQADSIYFSEALLFLRPSSDNKTLLNDLFELCSKIKNKIDDRKILKNIVKFTTYLDNLVASNDKLNSEMVNNAVENEVAEAEMEWENEKKED